MKDKLMAYVRKVYPDAIEYAWFPVSCELIFYTDAAHEDRMEPYACYIKNGKPVIATDF